MSYEVTIRDPDVALEATFIPELGMVGSSLRHQGEELLAQLDGPGAYGERGATFALPLLHPWANRLDGWRYRLAGHSVELDPDAPSTHRDGATGLPIHGLLAASPHWQLLDADRDRLTAELDFGAVPEYLAGFPFPHRLRYEARLAGGALTLAVTLTPTGEHGVPVAFGFHPYLRLPGTDRREWELTLPVAREALLSEQMLPTGETVQIAAGELDGPFGDRTFDTNFDQLYRDHGQTSFALADAKRRIEVRFGEAYPIAQVYAAAGSDFICYEPMTAPINAFGSGDGLLFVEPGSSLRAEFAIAVDGVDD